MSGCIFDGHCSVHCACTMQFLVMFFWFCQIAKFSHEDQDQIQESLFDTFAEVAFPRMHLCLTVHNTNRVLASVCILLFARKQSKVVKTHRVDTLISINPIGECGSWSALRREIKPPAFVGNWDIDGLPNVEMPHRHNISLFLIDL